MPMSSGGHVASSSGCATRPKVREIGLTGCAVPTQRSLLIGSYVMATAEHREPCDSRGSCTVLGAPGGEIPPGDSTVASDQHSQWLRRMSALPPRASELRHRRELTECHYQAHAPASQWPARVDRYGLRPTPILKATGSSSPAEVL